MNAVVTPPRPVDSRFWRHVRRLLWGGAAALLLLPAVAMRFTREVDWSAFDFVVMGLLLASVCGAFELALRVARSHAYLIAAGVALATSFLGVWITLAVGIIGSEGHPTNAIFLAVPAIMLVGAVMAQLRPRGMARTMRVAAGAQAITVAVAAAIGQDMGFLLPAGFVLMWLAAAQGFARAAREAGDPPG